MVFDKFSKEIFKVKEQEEAKHFNFLSIKNWVKIIEVVIVLEIIYCIKKILFRMLTKNRWIQ